MLRAPKKQEKYECQRVSSRESKLPTSTLPVAISAHKSVQVMGSFDGWSHGEYLLAEYIEEKGRSFDDCLRLTFSNTDEKRQMWARANEISDQEPLMKINSICCCTVMVQTEVKFIAYAPVRSADVKATQTRARWAIVYRKEIGSITQRDMVPMIQELERVDSD
ncbi:hypothetical protein Tco_0271158 [Tanacetum coccineum]